MNGESAVPWVTNIMPDSKKNKTSIGTNQYLPLAIIKLINSLIKLIKIAL
tara:strand:- start:1031 stop:1180 length:150 start_codon:yes stop_codon:yes gene_type:complete